jgi:hypothetical protein
MGICVAAGALRIMLAVPALHAQLIPATQPTAAPATNATPPSIPWTPLPGVKSAAAHPAQVTYADGKIDVRANDSSLNQILRAIAQKTGLKITGGVQDERVFGNYGSAPLSAIIATLLDGTGTNILFLEGDANHPPRLILTPRSGGVTPPGPDTSASDDQPPSGMQSGQAAMPSNDHPQPAPNAAPRGLPQPANNVNGNPSNTSPTASTLPTTNSVPLDTMPTPSTTPSATGIVDAPNPPTPGASVGAAPDGTVTPEQIYQELLKQQKQPQANPPNNTPPQP